MLEFSTYNGESKRCPNDAFYRLRRKVAIVRKHLLDGIPISDLCDKHGIHATQYYTWQKQLFENGAGCFARKANSANARRQDNARQKQIEQLEVKIQVKNEVVAELFEEHVKLKKASGAS